MKRAAPGSPRELAQNEAHQRKVISALMATGHRKVAAKLQTCQTERINRHSKPWPWRCRSAGCWACRRPIMRQWWRGFRDWLSGPDVSLAVLPVSGEVLSSVKRIRKAARDLRDRRVTRHHQPEWANVTITGMLSDDTMMLLIQHQNIDRDEVWDTWQQRWPNVDLRNPGNAIPSHHLTVEVAADLARIQKGIVPIRIVVPPQMAVTAPPEMDGHAPPIIF